MSSWPQRSFLAFISIAAPCYQVVCYPTASIPRETLHPRSLLSTTFYNAMQTLPIADHGAIYKIQVDATHLCGIEEIPNYSHDTYAFYPPNSTLKALLYDLDYYWNDTGRIAMALTALEQVRDDALLQWNPCHVADAPWDPDTTALGASFWDGEPSAPALPGAPSIDQGTYINSKNKGAITATLIKGTGSLIAGGLGVTSVLLSDPQAKMFTGVVAAGVSGILLFILSAAVDWLKNQDSLDASDAAILKMFAEWSRSTLEETQPIMLPGGTGCQTDPVRVMQRLTSTTASSSDKEALSSFGVVDSGVVGLVTDNLERLGSSDSGFSCNL